MPTTVLCPMPARVSSSTTSYVKVPLREITPTFPREKSPDGMIPIFTSPGERSPGQFGPITEHPSIFAYAIAFIVSCTGMCSVIATIVWIPAFASSMIESAAAAAGTKITLAEISWSRIASFTVL